MYRAEFEDYLIAQGCSGKLPSANGAVYQNKHNHRATFIQNGNWMSIRYIQTICATLDIDLPPEINDDGFDVFQFIAS